VAYSCGMGSIADPVLRVAEALIFASAEPVTREALARRLGPGIDIDQLIAQLTVRHAGKGFELVAAAGGWQFRTAPDLAAALQPVGDKPKLIPRVAMEVLVLIAYEQPVTRPEIEAFRGVAVSQKTMDLLLELNLIRAVGRKAAPGRPSLWATTNNFLETFGLETLGALPGGWSPLRAAD
jgi:segregation and condensation protein B